jgi:hypothetical protein
MEHEYNKHPAYTMKFLQSRMKRNTALRTPNTTRGFTALLAAIVASLLLLLSVAMFGIVRKEVLLSSIGRDSQFAFYAADTGAECALFWDFRFNAFEQNPSLPISCGNVSIGALAFPGYGNPITFQYDYEPMPGRQYCVDVTVVKNNSNPRTVIESRGYNTACDTISSNPRSLERAVQLRY